MSPLMQLLNAGNTADNPGFPVSRRRVIKWVIGGSASVVCSNHPLHALTPAAKPEGGKRIATAKSVIQVWMWGGPCHLDTFDPKPEAGADYCGAFTQPIETNVSGIRINELLPVLAKQADKFSILRGMTHGINAHETASYVMQTGHPAGDRIVYPSVGAVVSLHKGYGAGYTGKIPPYIVLTEPQGRFSECGFLGSRYKPFATGGNPAKQPFAVEGIVAEGITEDRQRSRRELLGKLDTLGNSAPDHPTVVASRRCEEEAYDLILGDGAKIFDLNQEKPELRDAYGRSTFGQACLMARRLVEVGVPYITINYKGWDTHKQHFQIMRRQLPEMDKGVGTLISDLATRGLLGSTIVWWGGEFGRTPKVQNESPWNGGRNHFGAAFCHMVAGGGFRGGEVVGATDARGEEVKERPVRPWDLVGSIYELMGIDTSAKLPHPLGLDARVVPGKEEKLESAGRLREIM
jgi:Protein of unknown function (DUF1501)